MIVVQNIQELKNGSPTLRALAELNRDHALRVAADLALIRQEQEKRLEEWRNETVRSA